MAEDITVKVKILLRESKRLMERAGERWVDDQELQEEHIKVIKMLNRVITIIDEDTKGE
jgi:hypothetical protein